MEIGPLVSRTVLTVGPAHTLAQAAQLMQKRNIGSAVVATEDGRPGIVTERDFLRAIADGADARSVQVENYMTPNAITATASCDVLEAARRMLDGRFRHLIVLNEEGRVEGVLSIRDLFRHLLAETTPSVHAAS